MTHAPSLEQQIAEAKRRKFDAENAENARLAAERANQEAIEKIDAEMTRLARLQRVERLQDVVAQQEAVIRDHQDNVKAFFAVLDTMLESVPGLFAAYDRAVETYKKQQEGVQYVHYIRQQDWLEEWQASDEYKKCQGLDERLIQVRRDSYRRAWDARNNSLIPVTKSPANELIENWLTVVKSQSERQQKSAIAALLFGEMR